MLFEDQLEQLKEYYQSVEARVLENSTVNALRDKYLALSPLLQKVLLGTACFVVFFLVLAGPISNYSSSVDEMNAFERRKALTEKIIAYKKKTNTLAPKPKEYDLGSLKRKVLSFGESFSINLLPEQISVMTSRAEKKVLPSALQKNFNIKTNKANIDQITALTYSIQKENKSLLIESLEFNANREDPSYFNGSIVVANLFVKSAADILPKPENDKKGKRKSRRRGRGSK